MNKLFFIYFSVIAFLLLAFSGIAFAQVDSTGVAVTIPIEGDVEDGAVLCSGSEAFVPCSVEYSPGLYGVKTESPSVVFDTTGISNPHFAISSGVVLVRVTNSNGGISIGDFITSSETPGVGQKATRNGFVLGSALEAYDSGETGNILVSINIHPATTLSDTQTNLFNAIRTGLTSITLSPLASLRYILAFAVIIVSFAFSFIYFGRTVRAGVEAIGRNPLAGKRIQFTILFNTVVMIVILLVGLGIAYLILIL